LRKWILYQCKRFESTKNSPKVDQSRSKPTNTVRKGFFIHAGRRKAARLVFSALMREKIKQLAQKVGAEIDFLGH